MPDSPDAEFLKTLSAAGFPVTAISEIRERYAPLPVELVMLLLNWLPRFTDSRRQEDVAWSLLAARKRSLDGQQLAALFDSAKSDSLKMSLAAVVNEVGVSRGDDWLIGAFHKTNDANTQNLLARAIAKWLPRRQSLPALTAAFERTPLAVVHPLSRLGGKAERDLLANHLAGATGPLRRELRQAIKRINRRLAKTQNSRQCD